MKLSSFVTIVVIVPEDFADQMREVLAEAGAGESADYSHGSFSMKGTARFLPKEGANPSIGKIGELETVMEERIETICAKDRLEHVLEEVKKHHPYEETVIDIYPIYEAAYKKQGNS